jgi:putative endonuclease
MASHNDFGKEAEEMAAKYLSEHGYQVLHRNWKYSKYEIDIIATKNDWLKFIEVKSLRTDYKWYPEKAVTKKKFKDILRAADEFLCRNKQYKKIQFDVLAITQKFNGETEFYLIEDVYL